MTMHVTEYADGTYYLVDLPRSLFFAYLAGVKPVVDEVVDGLCPWHFTAHGFCDCVEPDTNHPVSR